MSELDGQVETRKGSGRWLAWLWPALMSCAAAQAGDSGVDPPAAADDVGVFSRQIAIIDLQTAQLVDESGIPGLALAVVENDRVILARGYGMVDSNGSEPVTEHTAFRLASLSKGFAGTLAAMLVREGALRWDAHIVDYLPALQLRDRQAGASLTVRDILSHQVGIQPYNFLDRALEADQPYPLLAARLSEAPMGCGPGACYAYQNIAFSLIGDVSFAATGEFFYHAVEKRLFHPLGMRDATYGREALISSPSWARPHVRRGNRWQAVAIKENYYRVPPAAGINASASDMAAWLIAQLGHRPDVLSPDLLAEIHTPLVVTPDQLGRTSWRRDRLRAAHYGLGWRVLDYAGERMIYHAGAVQGYRAVIALLPGRNVGMAVLWHSESRAPTGLMPTIIDHALGIDDSDWLELRDRSVYSAQR